MKTLTKFYLHPKGISHSIVPTNRPSLSEWLKEFNCPKGSHQWWLERIAGQWHRAAMAREKREAQMENKSNL